MAPTQAAYRFVGLSKSTQNSKAIRMSTDAGHRLVDIVAALNPSAATRNQNWHRRKKAKRMRRKEERLTTRTWKRKFVVAPTHADFRFVGWPKLTQTTETIRMPTQAVYRFVGIAAARNLAAARNQRRRQSLRPHTKETTALVLAANTAMSQQPQPMRDRHRRQES